MGILPMCGTAILPMLPLDKPSMSDLLCEDLGRIDYATGLARQRACAAAVAGDPAAEALLLCEHDPPAITLGRRAGAADLRASVAALAARGVQVHRIRRGGLATLHAPGQLVAYPVVHLRRRGLTLRGYVTRLEQAVLDALAAVGVAGRLRPDQRGVWAGPAKIAAVGVAVQRWVATHGLALNVCCDPALFDLIVPCGQAGARPATVAERLGRPVSVDELKRPLAEALARRLGFAAAAWAPQHCLAGVLPARSEGIVPAASPPPAAKTPAVRTARPGRLPRWLRRRLPTAGQAAAVQGLLDELHLTTVCHGAHCPNRGECFARGTATFLILGATCTRSCRFCAVGDEPPGPPRPDEPGAVAEAAARMGLRHVVVTSVTRDDLPDGGARHFARTICAIRRRVPQATVEVLTPDFQGDPAAVDTVLAAAPDVFNHNVETVPRLYAAARPQADYRRSLAVLGRAAAAPGTDAKTPGTDTEMRGCAGPRPPGGDDGPLCNPGATRGTDFGLCPRRPRTKSGLMLGLGERDDEIRAVLADLRQAGCEMLTLGQYLAPSGEHLPVARFVPPAAFAAWEAEARDMGFAAVAAGPFVRSSYRAEGVLDAARQGS